jgi:hypothetical protein
VKEITAENINELDALQAKQNNGRGISCVKSIVLFLKLGQIATAIQIRSWDGDKITSYPEVEQKLTKMFGCRLHAIHNCENFLCK